MAWRKRQSRLREIAEGLTKAGALQFGPYTLPGGSESAYQVNLGGLPSYPTVHRLVVDSMKDLLLSKVPKAKAVCGLPVAGLTIAAPVALELGKPLVYPRQPRQPNERRIEGELKPGWRVVIVSDLAASGKTILDAAKLVEQEGADARDAVVLLDRLEGAREKLSKEGIALHSVTDVMELADTLHSMELIREADLKAIAKSVGGLSRP